MKQLVIILCICTLFFCCQKETKNTDFDNYEKNLVITRERSDNSNDQLKYRIILPEELEVNKSYSAIIEFESDFDTIVEPIQYAVKRDSTKSRLVYFFRFEPRNLSLAHNGYIVKDSAFVSNKKFTVENIVFEEKGEFLFQGYIYDELRYVFFDDQGKRDSVHFDQRRQMIKKKVVVVD